MSNIILPLHADPYAKQNKKSYFKYKTSLIEINFNVSRQQIEIHSINHLHVNFTMKCLKLLGGFVIYLNSQYYILYYTCEQIVLVYLSKSLERDSRLISYSNLLEQIIIASETTEIKNVYVSVDDEIVLIYDIWMGTSRTFYFYRDNFNRDIGGNHEIIQADNKIAIIMDTPFDFSFDYISKYILIITKSDYNISEKVYSVSIIGTTVIFQMESMWKLYDLHTKQKIGEILYDFSNILSIIRKYIVKRDNNGFQSIIYNLDGSVLTTIKGIVFDIAKYIITADIKASSISIKVWDFNNNLLHKYPICDIPNISCVYEENTLISVGASRILANFK